MDPGNWATDIAAGSRFGYALIDLIIMGGHGHKGIGDFVHGTSVERLRHLLSIPLPAVLP